ncbi:hypothetical protein ASPWEDRAFT_190461 [Aspergillus wentii DTO 134E9]|uniref:Alpha/beta hydrolase fold-3 domain-containing protein n=1 Tax=Aspergillus wentii DTO 134E9 TaxID=1073089 RepID=A0A1L9RYU8_ASPWE|nr:uncharacterized protein ASPWEDRAFT_190461 [Aspergillus wentii DTO 134E9]KAI9932507.1 hypothetical protein MW887_008748 [Aspergillus wentii]OJJ40073.1 hypothetical protein ASPWEDRAFT_190461 [Aspergillus wentii DTO 134E9]
MSEYNTPEAVLNLANIDPEFEQFLKQNPPPAGSNSIEALRKGFQILDKANYDASPTYGTKESTLTIRMRDGHENELRIVKPPTAPAEGSPLVTLIFGGAFSAGSNMQLIPVARMVAALYGATAVALSYRLSPEHKFPTAPDDVWDGLNWLAENASALGADLSKGWVVGGISAGANLSAVSAQRALTQKLSSPITGLSLCIPLTITPESVPSKYKHLWLSRDQNANAPSFGAQQISNLGNWYSPDHTSELYSPFHSGASFADLPPAHVQVAGMDPLRDDGLIYERALRENGVRTRLDVYPGVPHGHYLFFPGLKQSVKCKVDMIVGYGWLLGREVERERVESMFGL